MRQPTQPSEQPPSLPYFLLCLPRTLAAATNAGRFRLLPAVVAGTANPRALTTVLPSLRPDPLLVAASAHARPLPAARVSAASNSGAVSSPLPSPLPFFLIFPPHSISSIRCSSHPPPWTRTTTTAAHGRAPRRFLRCGDGPTSSASTAPSSGKHPHPHDRFTFQSLLLSFVCVCAHEASVLHGRISTGNSKPSQGRGLSSQPTSNPWMLSTRTKMMTTRMEGAHARPRRRRFHLCAGVDHNLPL